MMSNKSALVAGPKAVKASRPARVSAVVCRAQASNVDRRAMLGLIAASAPLFAGVAPSLAAYGDSANVFGRATNTSGYVPYSGDGFSILLPSKWNPSKEREFPNIVVRYEDNGDSVNSLLVIVEKTDKPNIEAYGPPEKFLESVSYLLGKQAFSGETMSEGGFAPNRVSAASLLEVTTSKDKKGKTFYAYEILTRTQDGNEGGRHQLIKATVSNGNLYIVKEQAGDKRWFVGSNKVLQGSLNSFTVA
eukprot:CAMPEP_0119111254 /NCGR_PEP_ID=MMETSP1180-20130426/34778_1 /TAXON_ID=3052 ORGANISM="Chlamydomonas cf sp, Strain CCMP681" /NCGR_SAMPLE_ID=MMETSP1180 /ASSEMBLY_ACC=CAM_ASM_000741 /LENGTH=246 /DNA_ID=CAMNT_0007098119 /DNA_START=76 /DNA_END=816 /DNA_ORIENTATION=+